MLKRLRIQNFKIWKDTGTIELAPLTVLLGSNSSGKSSIGQFLMLLKQSVASSDRKSVLMTGNENSAVDIGLPSEMIFNKETSHPLSFNYSWDTDKYSFSDPQSKKYYNFDTIDFFADVEVKDVAMQSLEAKKFEYTLSQDKGFILKVGLQKKEEGANGNRGYELVYDNYSFTRSVGRAWPITSPVRFYGFPDEAVAYYQNADFLQKLNLFQEKLFSKFYYLGPLRTKAKRIYTWTGNTPDSVGFQGEDTIFAILAAKNQQRMLNTKHGGKRKGFDIVIGEMLKKMNLIDDIKIERISEIRQDYVVKIKTKGSGNWVDIPDVGFGVSQVLPVLVELFYAPPGSTIIMEQPELHLHPGAQAGLADVMIDAVHANEYSGKRNIQLIIETHSEHFLRRLQRRIAEEALEYDNFRAYFVNTQKFPPSLDGLEVDLFGNIANWPQGFFGDISGDIAMQSKAAIDRRIRDRDKAFLDVADKVDE